MEIELHEENERKSSPKESDAYSLYVYGMRSPVTRDTYLRRLRNFFNHIQLLSNEEPMDVRCNLFIDKSRTTPGWAFSQILNFLQFQKDKVEKREISEATLKNFVKSIKLFCEMTEIEIGWKRITRGLPKTRRYADDRAPTLSEIQKIAESMEIKNLILHCYCIGYSINQTREYIQIKKGVKLEYQYVKNVRNNYVNGAADWLLELAQDKTAFIARFRDKIMQLESYRQSLLDLIFPRPDQHDLDHPKISPAIHIKAIDSLHKITLSLANLEKMLPLVTRFSKDMDIDELLKLNNIYKDELTSATNQAIEPHGGINLRPQYMEIERMVNSVMRKHQQDKDIAADTDNDETNSPTNTYGFRAIL